MSDRAATTRRILTLLAFIAAAAAAGYIVTCAIFPAPILPRAATVPALRGLPAGTALAEVAHLGLRGRLADTVADPLTAAGTVAWQSPAPETMLPEGAIVRLGVSSGAAVLAAPDVTDLDLATARDVIAAAGMVVGHIDTVRNDVEAGTVVATTPAPGASAHPGDVMALQVSDGAASVAVPGLVGLTISQARERLAAAGLRLGTLDQRFEGKAGTVLAQRPAPGELVTKESSVNLTISGTLP